MTITSTGEKHSDWQAFANTKLLPQDPKTQGTALGLYSLVAELPIISPHGHVDPNLLLENKPFSNPAELFIYFDHYVTRLLNADGVDYRLVRSPDKDQDLDAHARRAWREFAKRYHLYAGTSSGFWLAHEFESIFGLDIDQIGERADEFFDQIAAALTKPEMLPRALFERFKIEVLATTDSPTDDLAAHTALKGQLTGRIAPTFRPDAFINPLAPGWLKRAQLIAEQTGQPMTQDGFVAALAIRREFFKSQGGFSVDIGAETAYTTILEPKTAQSLYEKAVLGTITADEALQYRGHMISEMVRMSCEDGLVITLHVGVYRNHSTATLKTFGPDSGHDIPIRAEFVKNLHPVLERYGLHPNLHLILFCLDETAWSREIAPLAGFYPSVFVGAPWWFMDAPFAANRFREATVETAGFYRSSGFIDDTRAFLSIPARHDMARRVDSGFLAELVSRGQISLKTAEKIAVDLVVEIPKRAFKL